MKTKLAWLCLLGVVLSGCAGMDKPDLNKVFEFSASKDESSKPLDQAEVELSTSTTKSGESVSKKQIDPVLLLDAWIKENMW